MYLIGGRARTSLQTGHDKSLLRQPEHKTCPLGHWNSWDPRGAWELSVDYNAGVYIITSVRQTGHQIHSSMHWTSLLHSPSVSLEDRACLACMSSSIVGSSSSDSSLSSSSLKSTEVLFSEIGESPELSLIRPASLSDMNRSIST